MRKISLRDFVRTGQFGPVGRQITRPELRDLLGSPDVFGCPATAQDVAGIWKYGDIEFHFDSERPAKLWLIFCDDFDVPQGGPQIDLDPWIIRSDLARAELEQALRSLGVAFRICVPDYDDSQTLVITQQNVKLGFTHDDSGRAYVFSVSRRLDAAEPIWT
jgi:hypothetical protein